MGKSSRKLLVGIDLGGTNIQCGVLTPQGKVLARGKVKTKGDEGVGAVVKRIEQVVEQTLEDTRCSLRDVAALGIGAPGTVDIDKGMVVRAVNLRWNRVPLASLLSKKLRVPVVVDNDVNVAAWGEHVAGAGRGHGDMLAVWVGTGVGGGLVLGGKLYYGHFLTAGEIGHVVIQADAPVGRRTLENLASRTAVVNHLKQLISANHPSSLTDIVDGDLEQIRSKALSKALSGGDELTITVLQQAAKYVGIAAANVATLLSLSCVVVGGGVSDSLGKVWVEWVRESFETHVFPPEISHTCRVIASRLGDDAGIIGAGLLAQEKVWKTSGKK